MHATPFARAAALALCSLVVSCDDAAAPAPVTSQVELRDDLRELWTAQATWTRHVIVSATAALPDAEVARGRLLANQDEIGDALRPFYGDAVADRLTVLLREQVTLTLAMIAAERSGDQQSLSRTSAAWYASADGLARFLADTGAGWDEDALRSMMREHLDQTLVEANARIAQEWELEAATYDGIMLHAREIADALAAGLERELPALVTVSEISAPEASLHDGLRELSRAHATATRFYVVSALADLGDTELARARLLAAAEALADALAGVHGDALQGDLRMLMASSASSVVDVVRAVESGDEAALADARAAWAESAERLAVYFVGPAREDAVHGLRSAFLAGVAGTASEIDARSEGDWARDVLAADITLTNALDLADDVSALCSAR
jgi:hypothetical protein